MASAEQLPSGRWRGIYRDSAGKKLHVPGTFPRKGDAREAAQEEEVKARRRASAAEGTLSARTLWAAWWEVVKADRTFESDAGLVEEQIVRAYLMPQWADVPINKIIKRDIQRWVNKLEQGTAPVDMRDPRWQRRKLSAAYVQRIYSPFRLSITKAVDDEVLDADPCAGVKVPRRIKKAKPYLLPEESAALDIPQPYRDAVDLMHETGLRPNEMIGLHAHRIDRKQRILTVAEVYVFKSKKIRGFPKDKDSRDVPLTKRALEILDRRLEGRDHRKPCGVEHMRGEKCAHPLVFLSQAGRPLSRDMLTEYLRAAMKDAGLEAKSAYAIRRGAATRVAESGLDVFTMAELFGWADIKMAQEYVQQTSSIHDRMRAALGERQGLSVVDGGLGQHGTDRGTDPGSTTQDETGDKGAGNAV